MQNALSRPILLTGFGPFDRWTENSSILGAQLAASRASGRIVAIELPVEHAAAAVEMTAALAAHRPEIALVTGQTSEDRFRLERRARRPSATPWPDGPTERYGAWPWEASLAAVGAALAEPAAPPRLSDDCGGYVCETAYRALLDHRADAESGPRLAGFLHTPPLSERWTVERAATAIEAALSAAAACLAPYF